MTKEGTLFLLAAKEPMLLGLLLLSCVTALAGLAVVDNGLLVGRLGVLCLDLAGLEDVSGAAPAGVLSARAWSSRNTVALQSDRVHRNSGRIPSTGDFGDGMRCGNNLRLDILAQSSLGGVLVLGHVACAATARGDDGSLESGRLEVGGVQLGRLSGVGHVARTPAAVGSEVRHDGGCSSGGDS